MMTLTPEREAEIREHATKWLDILHPDNREGSAAATILDLLAALDAEREKVRRLHVVLKQHHSWHLGVGEIGLPDDKGGFISIDNGAEYSDSLMCEQTIAILKGTTP